MSFCGLFPFLGALTPAIFMYGFLRTPSLDFYFIHYRRSSPETSRVRSPPLPISGSHSPSVM